MSERRFTPDRWVRLSSTFQFDPRIMRAGPEAELVYVRALAFARSQRSDGHVSTQQIAVLVLGLTKPQQAVEALVREGLWDACDDGYRVPKDKWERWQTTEGEIDERRESDKRRKAEWRARQREQVQRDDDTY